MDTVRLTIPLGFQNQEFNCQSLMDLVREETIPERSLVDGPDFVAEWNFEYHDEADSGFSLVESILDSNSIGMDPEEEGYSGVTLTLLLDEDEEEEEDEEGEECEEDEEDDPSDIKVEDG